MQDQIDLEKQKMLEYFKVHQLSLKKVFSKLFNKKIKKITYLGKSRLKKIKEYEFSVLKFNIVLEKYYNYTVFIKLIDYFEIEKSLYCYWFFYEENYGINKELSIKRANITNQKSDYYEKRFELQLFQKNKMIRKKSLIDIISVGKYCKLYLKNSEDVNDLLFIAII